MTNHNVSSEMILRAQQLREELNFSNQMIVDEAEKIGMPVSMSTVRRFFAEDGPNRNFTAQAVQGIFAVLGQTNDKTEGMTAPEQVDLLKDIISFDRHLIKELDGKIASLLAQHQQEINQMRCAHSEEIYKIVSENHQRLDFLKATIEDFKTQIEVKDRRMDQRDTHFMQQIDLKDRRYDALLEKYDALLERYTAAQEGKT